MHISIQQTVEAEQSKVPWFTNVQPSKGTAFPLPKTHAFGRGSTITVHDGTRNSEDAADVKKIQRFFGIVPDGVFGISTERKVKAWQLKRLLRPTGRVGPYEWRRMGL